MLRLAVTALALCEALAGQARGLFAEASAAQRAENEVRQRAELGLAAK